MVISFNTRATYNGHNASAFHPPCTYVELDLGLKMMCKSVGTVDRSNERVKQVTYDLLPMSVSQ